MTALIKNSTCTMDCPDTCSLSVKVSDGKITEITADNKNQNTGGFICSKMSRFTRRIYSDYRIKTPLKQTGSKTSPKFVPISWDEAILEISSKYKDIIDNYGGEAILPCHYGGSNGFLTDELTDSYYFAKLGASRLNKTICAVPTTEVAKAMYGKMPGVAFEDIVHSRLIIIWGANPKKSNIHLIPYIKKAKQNGATICVIDPVNNYSKSEIDLFLPVKPGKDLPLALALINLFNENDLLDKQFINKYGKNSEFIMEQAAKWPPEKASSICGIAESDIRKLAHLYAQTSPALIRCGWGVERNINGGQAVAAILAIPALMGKFGDRGGGYALSNSGFARLHPDPLFSSPVNNTRILNMTRLGSILLDHSLKPGIKSLFIYNCNPVATVPDQNRIVEGLQREDLFTVVFDQVMTDSAQFADIILPATTFLEHHDLRRSYGSYYIGKAEPIIKPYGKSQSNHQVFSDLGRAMGWTDEIFHIEDSTLIEKVENSIRYYQKFSIDNSPVQFKSVFPATVSGKINLNPEILGDNPFELQDNRSDKYPLTLISPASSKTINSTMGEYNYPHQILTIHPADADTRHISQDQKVKIFNDLGEVICYVKISDKIRPGVVMLPKGAWRKASLNGQTATALCPAHINIVGGAACYNDALVEVQSAE